MFIFIYIDIIIHIYILTKLTNNTFSNFTAKEYILRDTRCSDV